MKVRRKRWRCPANPKVRPFDPVRWLGSEARGIPPPFTTQELTVMVAGSSGLRLAIMKPTIEECKAEANANIELNRWRFHEEPDRRSRPFDSVFSERGKR